MRPTILFPLYAPLETLKGVGPALQKTLKRLKLERVIDLLWHLPTGISHFPLKTSLKECRVGQPIAAVATIMDYESASFKRSSGPFRVICDVDDAPLLLTFFKASPQSLETRLPRGQKRLVCGTLDKYNGTWQITHPEQIAPAEVAAYWKEKTPTYPLTAGLFQSQIQRFTKEALQRLPALPEWIPEGYRNNWEPWHIALKHVHDPQQEKDLDPTHPYRQRLAFDELFASQLALGVMRSLRPPGRSLKASGILKEQGLKAFGHPLTPGQTQALEEIEADLTAPTRMVRLLQGDVGSGKTLVAFLSLLHAIEAGTQVALLAPTEILANQHALTLIPLAKALGLEVALLTSRQKNKPEIYEGLKQGTISLVIGTHALIQEAVQFKNLGFVVIDEQHRFGVEQRLQLTGKGQDVDVLVMTATPIPRTLCLTSYGDVEVSRILDKPQGRKPVQTHVMPLTRLGEICERLTTLLAQNQKIYWVCPLIEESETLDLSAATDRYTHLKALFGEETVGLVHGRQKGEEKEAVMAAFKDGPCRILVATTVIEVGIDVRDANYIIIEHAERLGLSQLHQLRGRVGRGSEDGHCLLLYGYPLSAIAKQRLSVMKESQDGFYIAEQDLSLRGGGDVLGTKQSGLPSYRLADPLITPGLLEEAHQAARTLLSADPLLTSPQGQAARILLHLFGQDRVLHTLRSG